jgi:hypothetical protein
MTTSGSARRSDQPLDKDPWEWSCGFYPGSGPGEHGNDTEAAFDQARENFEVAWRDQRDWQARKRAMWERGELLPSQTPNSLMLSATAHTKLASG